MSFVYDVWDVVDDGENVAYCFDGEGAATRDGRCLTGGLGVKCGRDCDFKESRTAKRNWADEDTVGFNLDNTR